MSKIYFLLILTLLLNSCNAQTDANSSVSKDNSDQKTKQNERSNGIIYFSFDNGNNWVNTSNGLPEKISIGLDGVGVSNQNLGVATKENGIYMYNFKANQWENVPTEKQIIEGNIGALAMNDSVIFVGTQFKGVFCTKDNGKTWINFNVGLTNWTVRRFCEFNHKLYVCTNDGFYAFNKDKGAWQLVYGESSLQVNGATLFSGNLYLATNKGIYTQQKDNSWLNSSPQFSMHNISSDEDRIYAMTYNELLLSSKDGKTWHGLQNGLPKSLYTFNVLNHNTIIFAGQWDGIYRKNINNSKWESSSNGLPTNFAVTNLKAFNDILVISTSERKLKNGMTTEK
jgi:ligand-binding sensor domain-containing protein